MKAKVPLLIIILVSLWPVMIFGQAKKEVTHNTHLWVSINSTIRFSERWGMIADFHNRTGFAFQDPRFYFIRLGSNFWIQDKMTAAVGYAHTWFSPSNPDWNVWANENRIYQQFLFTTGGAKTQVTQRFRNEQRWIQKIENDTRTGTTRFVNRIRYLLSFNFNVFKNPEWPSLVVADEILVHFGNDIIYNPMDQNRFFLGFKQNLNSHLSFDLGYMNVYQQRRSGYQYDMNHTVRLFFYYNGGWSGVRRSSVTEHHDE